MSKELSYRSIKEMLFLLDSSKKIYKNYLSGGHKFLYAKDLRSINKKILNLINCRRNYLEFCTRGLCLMFVENKMENQKREEAQKVENAIKNNS